MSDLLLCALDFETSGLDLMRDRPVQVGLVLRFFSSREVYQDHVLVNQLCDPGKPIDPGAAAVHGITDAQVKGLVPAYDVVNYLSQLVAYYSQGREAYVVTYNGSNFDIPMMNNLLGREGVTLPQIDVLRFIRHYFPAVRGAFGGKTLGEMHQVFLNRSLASAHDAVADIAGTLDLLRALQVKAGVSLAQIAQEQSQPRPYTVMPLGKYTGVLVSEVPKSWATFMSSKDLDPDLRATVDYILARD